MSVLAVIQARNEAGFIETTLASLIAEGIEVVLLDHGSIDGTPERAERFLGVGLLRIEHVPWRGVFDLEAMLRAKQAVYETTRHDWLMHLDADEWPRATSEERLADLLGRLDERYAVVDFEEFVFLPPPGIDLLGEDHRVGATSYYFFEPRRQRLQRAWRSRLRVSNLARGGHRLEPLDPGLIYPEDQQLRHYIGLSWSHAISKRADRTYAAGDLARGWHGNRLDMRAARPVILSPLLRRANRGTGTDLDRSAPSTVHFWHADSIAPEPTCACPMCM